LLEIRLIYTLHRPSNTNLPQAITEVEHIGYIFLLWRNNPYWAKAFLLLTRHDPTQTHHTREDASERVINPTQRPLHGNTQHSQETGIHAPAGFELTVPAS